MTAKLRFDGPTNFRRLKASAIISGFILDLDSDMPNDVFALIDVFQRGVDRMSQLAPMAPNWDITHEDEISAISQDIRSSPSLMILASMTFLSGKVRMYSGVASSRFKSRARTYSITTEQTDEKTLEYGADIFKLPMVSVLAEYRPASLNRLTVEPVLATLVFKTTIHSSQNILRPTLLPFLTEVVSRVEKRMRSNNSHRPNTLSEQIVQNRPTGDSTALKSRTQIGFSLRIDQSRLELTCHPDVNVLAGLYWENGGFIVTVTPDRDVTLSGLISGLTIGLKHGFLTEECLRLDARNLSFSISFAKRRHSDTSFETTISFVSDTEFSGSLRLSRFQDLLCFKAVWMDHLPVFASQSNSVSLSPSKSVVEHATQQSLVTLVIIRIRRIGLEINLGQSISTVKLDMAEAVVRMSINELKDEITLLVHRIDINASGNLSGQVGVGDCEFRTYRIKTDPRRSASSSTSKLLQLRMTSGPLNCVLESEHRELLQYQ